MRERETYIPFGKSKDTSLDYLLGIIKDARVTTLQRVDGISKEELQWQFDEEWNTIGVLLSHIIACEHVFRIEFIQNRRMTKPERVTYDPGLTMGKYIPELITNNPIEFYIEKLEESRKLLMSEIEKIDVVDFYKRREGYNERTGYNLAWVLYHLAEDEVHHRGQISILRKLYLKINR